MSTRYGIELVLEPAFTARAYRARQIICGQFGSWAAEMHTVRMSLAGYLQCADPVVDQMVRSVGQVAEESRKRSPGFSIDCHGLATGETNSIYLDFQLTDSSHPLMVLQREITAKVGEWAGTSRASDIGEFHAKINLMEYANLTPTVLADAYGFAKGVATDLGVPSVARAWRLAVLRYHSEAAGDDWSRGGWAADLHWEYLSSHIL